MRSASPSHLCLALGLASAASLAQAANSPDDTGDAPVAQVTVTAARDTGTYNSRSTSGATRTDTPILELPQSVRVVGLQQIDDIGATRLADTVDYVSGIARLNDFGGTWDNFAIRGFSSTDMGFLVNGFPGSRGYNPPRDTATVERFEFLKGPASAVYGSSEPGGTINIVTKKPKFSTDNVVELSAGTRGLRRATLDSTGALNSRLAYRLNLVTEEGDSRSSLLGNRRTLAAPALTWRIDDVTTFNYEAEFLRVDTPLDRGLINVRGQLGLLPVDRVLNEPADGKMHLSSTTHQATLDRVLANDWHARIGASYKQSTFDGNYTEATSLAADNRTLNRQATWRQLPSRDASLQAELSGNAEFGGMTHGLLFGADASTLWMNTEILRSTNYPIDIYNPVYGTAAPALTLRTSSSDERQRAKAFFMQDQLTLAPRWKLLLGARRDDFSQHVENRVARTVTSRQQQAWSPRAGLTYLPDEANSLYVSIGRSFRGNTGTDVNGQAFDPQRSRALEAGWKFQRTDGRLGATVAAYDIVKTNVLTASSVPGYSVAAGEVKSTGLDADVYGQLDLHWRLTANASWDNARVTRDNTLAAGTRLMNVPKTSAGLLLIREDSLVDGRRYGVGGGLHYVGNRSGNTADTYSLPAYTTAKLLGYWQLSKTVRLSVDVDNVFNRTYYTGSWGNLYVIPGAQRSIVGRLKIDL